MKSVFFLPVYNQIKEFPRVLEDLTNTNLPCDTILLVNNGSNDGSEELVRSSAYSFIDVPQNLGIGYSYRLALLWALERDYQIFGVMAGNGKMLAKDLKVVISPILNGEVDYVTGSRYLPGGHSPNLPRFREVSIPLVNAFVRILTGIRLTDSTCGYRAFKLDLILRAKFDWQADWLNTYGLEYYLFAKVILNKQIRWKEVPVTMRYPAKGQPYSKIRPGLDWWAMLRPWIVARFDGKGFAPRK
jgi:dolichol-phosphate mannosyltransferase